jgi:hypothetical protein
MSGKTSPTYGALRNVGQVYAETLIESFTETILNIDWKGLLGLAQLSGARDNVLVRCEEGGAVRTLIEVVFHGCALCRREFAVHEVTKVSDDIFTIVEIEKVSL